MKYRRLGTAPVEVSEIGLGTYSLSGVYGKVDVDSVKETIKRAYELGVTFFDTAPSYGNAEKVLREIISDFRDHILISTKVGGGMAGQSCSYENIVSSCEQSLRNLGVDRLDLYGIHFDDGRTPVEDIVRAFEDLKSAGKIRCYGLGHVFEERAARFMDAGEFCTVMGELSIPARGYYDKMLPLLRKSGAGYLAFSVTARGLLTGSVRGRSRLEKGDIRHVDALFMGERLKSAFRIIEKMAETAGEIGASRAQIAIRWVLNRGNVACAICGPSSARHMEENVGASGICGDTDSFKALEAFIDGELEKLANVLREEITGVLRSPFLGADDIPRLIYAAEGMGELGMVPDEKLIPEFKRLFACMRGDTREDIAVNQVKEALANLLGD